MQTHYADLVDCDIRYLVGGEGPPLVCIHPSSGVRITQALEELMQSFTVYLPALPGFDETAPPRLPVTMPQLGKWMGEFIDKVAGKKVNVSGHSFGGWVTAWLAVQRPDIVDSLILQCPAGFRPPDMLKPDADPATLLERTFAHPERRRPETKTEAVIAANRKLAAAYTGGVLTDIGLIARVSEIQARTLVLHGKKDGMVPIEGAFLLERIIPAATLVLIDDAAHNIEVDQPDDFARACIDFLKGNSIHV